MRVLITGGAGFIGSHVADAAVQAGHEVLVLDDLSSGKRANVPARAELVVGDVRDRSLVESTFARFRPEAVSHQAAQVSVAVSTREPVRDAEVNVLGTLNVLEAAVRAGTRRVVFASTGGAIYGEIEPGRRARVGEPERPLSPYACSKRAAELYLFRYQHEHGLAPSILRYANVYGPRQDPHGEAGVVAIFCERLLAGQGVTVFAQAVEGDEGCGRDYVFVGDVVKANVRALGGGLTAPIVNVATGVETSTRTLATLVAEAAGVVAPRIGSGPRRTGDVLRSVLEPSPEATGAPLTTLAAGLAATVAWFRDRA
jgi:UDP-glucose 4-epimerase